MTSARRLGRVLARLFRAVSDADPRPDVRPRCEFGLVVEQRLDGLAEDLREVRNLLRAVLLVVVGGLVGLVVDIVVRGL